MLMKSGFQVHNPEEVEARSSVSQKGGQNLGSSDVCGMP
ncbi:hypothetical protein AO9_01445 [Chlamydia psittaci Mat116]|nr:hypothetical protein AO9_01445 [Chlamydia psittaci Mat116]